MKKKYLFVVGLVVWISMAVYSCDSHKTSVESSQTRNSMSSMEKPYLIVVSLDGFRWDYVERFAPPHMSSFIEGGVKASSLVPSFPSKTFPNHYTIVTGMYPDKHGIIGNSFYSYKKDQIYKIGNRQSVEDGTFYGGSPIWVQAEKEGMVSASYFFVGSEANVQGIRPTYYHKYDGSIPNEDRVAQVLEWLNMTPEERPHMITMYFSDMDDTGHEFGPSDDEELKKALYELDENLGALFDGAFATGLPVNIMVVSDHGMSNISPSHLISIEDVKNEEAYMTVNNGALVNIYPKAVEGIDEIYKALKEKEQHFKVYRTKDTPGFEYVPSNKDWGAIQLIPDPGYYFVSASLKARRSASPDRVYGVHGYDPEELDMHGIFYAKGPSFKKGYTIPSVKNIHLYPLMCNILGLEIPDNIDGDLEQVKQVLVESP